MIFLSLFYKKICCSDIDETFVTTSDWPFSQQDLYNELHSDDDEDNPLKFVYLFFFQ